jgi:hypothetical protein
MTTRGPLARSAQAVSVRAGEWSGFAAWPGEVG